MASAAPSPQPVVQQRQPPPPSDPLFLEAQFSVEGLPQGGEEEQVAYHSAEEFFQESDMNLPTQPKQVDGVGSCEAVEKRQETKSVRKMWEERLREEDAMIQDWRSKTAPEAANAGSWTFPRRMHKQKQSKFFSSQQQHQKQKQKQQQQQQQQQQQFFQPQSQLQQHQLFLKKQQQLQQEEDQQDEGTQQIAHQKYQQQQTPHTSLQPQHDFAPNQLRPTELQQQPIFQQQALPDAGQDSYQQGQNQMHHQHVVKRTVFQQQHASDTLTVTPELKTSALTPSPSLPGTCPSNVSSPDPTTMTTSTTAIDEEISISSQSTTVHVQDTNKAKKPKKFVSVREKVKILEQKVEEADAAEAEAAAAAAEEEGAKEDEEESPMQAPPPSGRSETPTASANAPIRPEEIPGAVRVLPPGRKSPGAFATMRSISSLGFGGARGNVGHSRRSRSSSVDSSFVPLLGLHRASPLVPSPTRPGRDQSSALSPSRRLSDDVWNLPKLEPFPFKPDPVVAPLADKGPPPPKPTKFVPGWHSESEVDPQVEDRPSKWNQYSSLRVPGKFRSQAGPPSAARSLLLAGKNADNGAETPRTIDRQTNKSSSVAAGPLARPETEGGGGEAAAVVPVAIGTANINNASSSSFQSDTLLNMTASNSSFSSAQFEQQLRQQQQQRGSGAYDSSATVTANSTLERHSSSNTWSKNAGPGGGSSKMTDSWLMDMSQEDQSSTAKAPSNGATAPFGGGGGTDSEMEASTSSFFEFRSGKLKFGFLRPPEVAAD